MGTDQGYAGGVVTKPPNWHGLVVFDVLFNNLATGLFLAAALCELASPGRFATVARVAYPVALVLLLADLALLVLDLGDPLRFHHMLRVFKPSSPMSLGTWCLTAFSLQLTVLAALSLFGVERGWLYWAALAVGLPSAFGAALYKGVLFSTSSQPGWKDARWLGAYLTNSALLLGCAQLLVLSILVQEDLAAASLRRALVPLLLLNAVALRLLWGDVRASLPRPYTYKRAWVGLAGVALGMGVLVPLGMLLVGGPILSANATLLIVMAALAVRVEIVRFPHLMRREPQRG